MLSAIVVNKKHVATGDMDPSGLEGFAAAARELGHVVADPLVFLKEQQNKCFDWGAETVGEIDAVPSDRRNRFTWSTGDLHPFKDKPPQA